MSTHVLIIAEVGVNHNGSLDTALSLVDAAVQVGANAVKFQTFRAPELATTSAPKATYQAKSGAEDETQLEMLRELELSENDHRAIAEHCRRSGIEFMSTAFDEESLELLMGLGIARIKVPSGELTNGRYLQRVGTKGLPVILSTGMADIEEVGQAIEVLTHAGSEPCSLTLLHCTSAYPTPFDDVNLRAMTTMRETFDISVGYSDHTLGTVVSVAAVACGACVIEKHLTLDRSMKGPDHRASLEPAEFDELVRSIRSVESALGDGMKRCMPSELETRDVARRSIVARRDLPAGKTITPDDLALKRPGTGLSPMMWDRLVGRSTSRPYRIDEELEW